MEVAILLYPGTATVEALGPAVVLRRVPSATIRFVAAEPGRYLTHEPPLIVEANHPLGWARQPDVLVVPGGFGIDRLLEDGTTLAWVKTAAAGAVAVIGASTGALALAAAGVLEGVDATTHWLARDRIQQYGARPVDGQPVVHVGRLITTGGGAATLEAALVAAELVAGQEVAAAIRDEMARDPAAFDFATVDGVTPLTRPRRGRFGFPWRRRQPRRVITLVHS